MDNKFLNDMENTVAKNVGDGVGEFIRKINKCAQNTIAVITLLTVAVATSCGGEIEQTGNPPLNHTQRSLIEQGVMDNMYNHLNVVCGVDHSSGNSFQQYNSCFNGWVNNNVSRNTFVAKKGEFFHDGTGNVLWPNGEKNFEIAPSVVGRYNKVIRQDNSIIEYDMGNQGSR